MKYIYTYFIIISILTVFPLAYSCPITLTNDSQLPLLAFDQTTLQSAQLQPGQTVSLGNATTHPNIAIAQQDPSMTTNPIQYNVTMTGCAPTKTPITISFSDLQNNNIPAILTLKDYTQNTIPSISTVTQKVAKTCGCKRK